MHCLFFAKAHLNAKDLITGLIKWHSFVIKNGLMIKLCHLEKTHNPKKEVNHAVHD